MDKEKRELTDREKAIVQKLNDGLFTVEYLEEWINRTDNVIVNVPAALAAVEAKGFYRAIQLVAKQRLK